MAAVKYGEDIRHRCNRWMSNSYRAIGSWATCRRTLAHLIIPEAGEGLPDSWRHSSAEHQRRFTDALGWVDLGAVRDVIAVQQRHAQLVRDVAHGRDFVGAEAVRQDLAWNQNVGKMSMKLENYLGGRIAQWIAYLLLTQWPRVRFSAFPRFFQILMS